jgi:TolB-like protein
MKNYRLVPIGVSFLISVLLFFIFSCAQKAKPQSKVTTIPTIHRIAILPFKDQSALKGKYVATQCSICGNVFTTGNVIEGAENHLTKTATALINKKETVTVVLNDRLESAKLELQLNDKSEELPQAAYLGAVGAQLGADAVLTGYVYRFEQRIGTPMAADTPASVGFDIYMISAPEGRLLWHARFDESQKSLFENLLKFNTFVERKGKWLTAEELSEYGLKKVLERSPIP